MHHCIGSRVQLNTVTRKSWATRTRNASPVALASDIKLNVLNDPTDVLVSIMWEVKAPELSVTLKAAAVTDEEVTYYIDKAPSEDVSKLPQANSRADQMLLIPDVKWANKTRPAR